MRILLILLLLLANLMLFGANHQMFGPQPSAGLRNPAPLARELNPASMQVRPMAPGEYVDHPVVGPADPTVKVKQSALTNGGDAASAAGASAAVAGSSAIAASGIAAGSLAANAGADRHPNETSKAPVVNHGGTTDILPLTAHLSVGCYH